MSFYKPDKLPKLMVAPNGARPMKKDHPAVPVTISETVKTAKACYEAGVNFKATGDCLIIAPQFICEKKHIDEIIEKLRTGISNYMKK